jgi:acyl carrier protein
MSDTAELHTRIKEMLVTSLMLKITPAEIGDDVPLFAPEGLGLDSIDALELAVSLEKNFGVATPNAEVAREAFHSVRTIGEFVTRGGK